MQEAMQMNIMSLLFGADYLKAFRTRFNPCSVGTWLAAQFLSAVIRMFRSKVAALRIRPVWKRLFPRLNSFYSETLMWSSSVITGDWKKEEIHVDR